MATPKKSGTLGTARKIDKTEKTPKRTSIGHSKNTSYKSKNDKTNKKKYRGQG